MDADDMRAWQKHEETGEYPDSVYIPTEEDLQDPDHHEVGALVVERYDAENRSRRERRQAVEISALRELLEENGIDPDQIHGS